MTHDPHTVIRHQLIPPAPMVQAGHAWRSTVRPQRVRPGALDFLAPTLICAALAVFVWTL